MENEKTLQGIRPSLWDRVFHRKEIDKATRNFAAEVIDKGLYVRDIKSFLKPFSEGVNKAELMVEPDAFNRQINDAAYFEVKYGHTFNVDGKKLDKILLDGPLGDRIKQIYKASGLIEEEAKKLAAEFENDFVNQKELDNALRKVYEEMLEQKLIAQEPSDVNEEFRKVFYRQLRSSEGARAKGLFQKIDDIKKENRYISKTVGKTDLLLKNENKEGKLSDTELNLIQEGIKNDFEKSFKARVMVEMTDRLKKADNVYELFKETGSEKESFFKSLGKTIVGDMLADFGTQNGLVPADNLNIPDPDRWLSEKISQEELKEFVQNKYYNATNQKEALWAQCITKAESEISNKYQELQGKYPGNYVQQRKELEEYVKNEFYKNSEYGYKRENTFPGYLSIDQKLKEKASQQIEEEKYRKLAFGSDGGKDKAEMGKEADQKQTRRIHSVPSEARTPRGREPR